MSYNINPTSHTIPYHASRLATEPKPLLLAACCYPAGAGRVELEEETKPRASPTSGVASSPATCLPLLQELPLPESALVVVK